MLAELSPTGSTYSSLTENASMGIEDARFISKVENGVALVTDPIEEIGRLVG